MENRGGNIGLLKEASRNVFLYGVAPFAVGLSAVVGQVVLARYLTGQDLISSVETTNESSASAGNELPCP